MQLATEYQRILDQTFAKHFPGWEGLSPLDPMRTLADAMVGCLEGIERRQQRYLSGILDSVPALYGFTPKPARLPVQLLGLKPSSKLRAPESFPSETAFRFQAGAEICYALSKKEFRLSPISDFIETRTATSIVLAFTHYGLSPDIEIQFLPSSTATRSPLSRVKLSIDGISAGATELLAENDTEEFTRFGTLRVRSRRPQSVLLPKTFQQVELHLAFSGELPQGSFAANVVACDLAMLAQSMPLGALNGEPWEEIGLPDTISSPPQECVLIFADERSLVLAREDERLLESSHLGKSGFFYNGVNHSLVFPRVDELVGNYNGTVQVLARRAVLQPAFDALPSEYRAAAGDYSSVIDEITPLSSVASRVSRENKSRYLERFYQTLAAWSTEKPAPPRAEGIRHVILSSEPSVQCVEIGFEPDGSMIVYLLEGDAAANGACQLRTELCDRVSRLLSDSLPTSVAFRVSPFRRVTARITLEATVERSLVPSDVLEVRYLYLLKKYVSPPPFGELHADTDYAFEQLVPFFEASTLRGSLLVDGRYTSVIRRRAGELFSVEAKVEVLRG